LLPLPFGDVMIGPAFRNSVSLDYNRVGRLQRAVAGWDRVLESEKGINHRGH
jgi:hypothetical protein